MSCTENLGLIDQARRLQTGENVHRLGRAIGRYCNEIILGGRLGWTPERIEQIDRYERELQEMVNEIVRETMPNGIGITERELQG